MLGRTPASTAAFSLDAPRAIASQNRTRCSRRPAGGCPPQRVPAAAARLHARFLLGIATPQRQALRQPVESTPSTTARTPPARARPSDTTRRTPPDQAARPCPARTTPNDPPAANRATTAASETPAHDHNPGSSGAYPGIPLPPPDRPTLRDSLHAEERVWRQDRSRATVATRSLFPPGSALSREPRAVLLRRGTSLNSSRRLVPGHLGHCHARQWPGAGFG